MERIYDLATNEVTEDELRRHGLFLEHAYQVFEERPLFLRQKARDEIAADGSIRRRPERVQMIGPDRTGRLLTIIIERPVEGVAHVVTGWLADKDQRDHYRKSGRGGRA